MIEARPIRVPIPQTGNGDGERLGRRGASRCCLAGEVPGPSDKIRRTVARVFGRSAVMIPDRGPCSFRRFSNGVMAEGHDSIFSVAERRIPYENPENPSSAPRRGAGGPGRPAAVRPRLRGGGGRRSRQQHVRHLLGPGPPHHRHHPGTSPRKPTAPSSSACWWAPFSPASSPPWPRWT